MTTLAVINSAVERLNYLIECASGAVIEEVLNGLEQLKSDLEQAAKALSAANNNLGTEVNRLLRELSHDIEHSAELFIAQQASEALSSASIWSDFSRCFFSSYEQRLADDVLVFSRRARRLVDSFGDKGLLSSKGGDNHSRPTAELQLIDPRHIREPGPIALEGYVENLMEALVGGGEGLSVIPICGMGGIGKTTLARKVYNHPRVRAHFKCLAWSTVTQDYQSRHILSSVLTTISWANHSKIAAMDTMELFVMLHKHLSGRRYLIVLDDVWSTAAWESLRFVFPDGCNGSRIVITTRSVEVAHYTSTSPPIQMKMLTDEQSWELFKIKTGLLDYPERTMSWTMKTILHKNNGQ